MLELHKQTDDSWTNHFAGVDTLKLLDGIQSIHDLQQQPHSKNESMCNL